MYYTDQHTITIRRAHPGDDEALRRLAQLDSAEPPGGAMLVALVGDELRAAVSIGGGQTIADPFHPSAELVRLLSARAAQFDRPRNAGLLGRLRRGRRRSALAPQPAGTLRVLD